MKLIVLRTNLKEGLSALDRSISDNQNLPILKNILLKTHNGKLHVSATNLELGVLSIISGKIIEDGSITVPFGAFYNIVSNSDAERLTLEQDKNILLVRTDNYNAKIQGMAASEFPIIPQLNTAKTVLEINSTTLKQSLADVTLAAQISEIRPEISGVLIDFQVSSLKFIATDSFRLAQKLIPPSAWKTSAQEGLKVIIPLRTAQEIVRIFPNDVLARVAIDENQILVKTEDRELVSRLIDGRYPDYEHIIPPPPDTEISVNRERFVNAVKLVSSLAGKTNDVRLRLPQGSKALEVYSASQSVGENHYLIPAKVKGPGFAEVSFNWRYLLDGVKPQSGESLTLGVSSNQKPATLQTPNENSYLYIVMPIRTS